MNSGLLDQIYEAAIFAERWPLVLDNIADRIGAVGTCFIATSADGVRATGSSRLQAHLDAYIAEGWAANPERTAPLFAEQYPGFRVETDYSSEEEIARQAAHAEFLDPRGLRAGAATVIQGTGDRLLFFAAGGFQSHDSARAALPLLDALRPHLARAISLSALHQQRTQLVVDSLALTGAAAAVVGADGRMRAANDGFTARMGDRMLDTRLGLRFADPFLQRQFALALERHRAGAGAVQSVAVRDPDGGPSFAIHLLPIKGAARDLCEADGVLLLIADGANASVPDADLLRLLFDLTPAEARLTRLIAEGLSLRGATGQLGITEATGRVHLKRVFAKTGVQRQAELVRSLVGLGINTEIAIEGALCD